MRISSDSQNKLVASLPSPHGYTSVSQVRKQPARVSRLPPSDSKLDQPASNRPQTPPSLIERVPIRWLLIGSALLCLLLWAAPSWSQTSAGDALNGQQLFNDTPNQPGVPTTVINSCTNCHGSVQNRRTKIGGSEFADISFDTAANHLGQAIGTRAPMAQYQALSSEQVADLAAYIADVPKLKAPSLSGNGSLAFKASATGAAVTQNLTVAHSVATADNLQVTALSLGAGTTAFKVGGSCVSTLAPAGHCSFPVTYTPTGTATESRTLTVSLKQGTVAFTRTLALEGSVTGTTTPPAPPASGSTVSPSPDDDGGGALHWMWLAGLGLATWLLQRQVRR